MTFHVLFSSSLTSIYLSVVFILSTPPSSCPPSPGPATFRRRSRLQLVFLIHILILITGSFLELPARLRVSHSSGKHPTTFRSHRREPLKAAKLYSTCWNPPTTSSSYLMIPGNT
ncbi:hypothetical protein CPB84DRAFT_1765643 [Gymnopilus junonius]|uniref:Uncharacterized protein n=1 Tax=Gymnopilus junonius TaxID=109634 RepID=A0A9P5NWK4_GYMJU|nr:hypothetical protein CPB84DRAFT_1765643 [Gymnopilus junonius]